MSDPNTAIDDVSTAIEDANTSIEDANTGKDDVNTDVKDVECKHSYNNVNTYKLCRHRLYKGSKCFIRS